MYAFASHTDGTAPKLGSARIRGRRRLLVGLAVSVVALAGTACGKGSGPGSTPASSVVVLQTGIDPHPLPTKTKIVVGMAQTPEGFSVVQLAIALREFSKENLDVRIEQVGQSATVIPLLDQGRVQVAASGPFGGFFNAVSGGSNLRFILGFGDTVPSNSSSGWYQRVTNGSTQADPCALKGKKIGMTSGLFSAAQGLGLARYLEKCKLTPGDVVPLTMISADVPAALASGAVDAGFIQEPFTTQVVSKGTGILVAPSVNGSGGFMVGKFAQQNPAALQAFVRAMIRTSQTYLQGNYHDNLEVTSVLSKWTGVPAATIKLAHARHFDLYLTTNPVSALVSPLQEFWIALGDTLQYKTAISLDRLVDTRWVDAAKKK